MKPFGRSLIFLHVDLLLRRGKCQDDRARTGIKHAFLKLAVGPIPWSGPIPRSAAWRILPVGPVPVARIASIVEIQSWHLVEADDGVEVPDP